MDSNITHIRGRITDALQIGIVIFLFPTLFFSLLRSKETGWQWLYLVHITFTILVILIFYNSKKLSILFKIHFYCSLGLLVSFLDAYKFGLSSTYYFCILSTVASTLILGKRVGYYYLAVSVLGVSIIGFLHCSYIIKPNINFNTYNYNITSWLAITFSLLYLLLMSVKAIGLSHEEFNKSINLLIQKTKEQEISQAALKLSEEQYRILVNNALMPVIVTKFNGEIVFVNSATEKLFGDSFNNLSNKSVLNFWIDLDAREDFIRALTEKGVCENKEVEFFNIKKEPLSLVLSANTIIYDGEPAILSVLKNITDLKISEILKQKNQQLLIEKERAEVSEQLTKELLKKLTRSKEELEQSESKYKQAQKIGHIGSWELDLINKQFWGSDEAKRIYGFDLDDNNLNFSIVTNRVINRTEADIALKVLLEEHKPYNIELEIKPFNGEENKILNSIAELVKDELGTPVKILGTIQDITARKKVEGEMIRLNKELRELANHLQTIREEERMDIAKEIHDELAQNLVALNINATYIKNGIKDQNSRMSEVIEEQITIANNLIKTSRSLFNSLHSTALNEVGFFGAIEWYAENQLKEYKIDVTVNSNVEDTILPEEISYPLFRVFQEIIANIKIHSKASSVIINLTMNNNILSLTISDNGIGFETSSIDINNSHGLLVVRERIYAMNGKIVITSGIKEGTTLKIDIPIN